MSRSLNPFRVLLMQGTDNAGRGLKPNAAGHDASAVIRHVSRVRLASGLHARVCSSRAPRGRLLDGKVTIASSSERAGDSHAGHQIMDMHKLC